MELRGREGLFPFSRVMGENTQEKSFRTKSLLEFLNKIPKALATNEKKIQTFNKCNDLDGYQGRYAEWKKPTSRGYIQYDSMYITFLK